MCIVWKGECTGQMVSEMIWMVKFVMVLLVIVSSSSDSNGVECYPAGLSGFYSCQWGFVSDLSWYKLVHSAALFRWRAYNTHL